MSYPVLNIPPNSKKLEYNTKPEIIKKGIKKLKIEYSFFRVSFSNKTFLERRKAAVGNRTNNSIDLAVNVNPHKNPAMPSSKKVSFSLISAKYARNPNEKTATQWLQGININLVYQVPPINRIIDKKARFAGKNFLAIR